MFNSSSNDKKSDSREEGLHHKPVTQLMVQAVRRSMEIMTDDTLVPCVPFGAQDTVKAETEKAYFALLTVEDVAQLRDCSPEQVLEMFERHEIEPALMIGGSLLFPITILSDCPVFQHFCEMDPEAYERLGRDSADAKKAEAEGLHFHWTGSPDRKSVV